VHYRQDAEIFGFFAFDELYPSFIDYAMFFTVFSLFVSMGVRGKPRMYYSLAGFLYRPLWTFQLWPPEAPAPIDAFRTLAAEVGTYGRGIRTGNLA
jgi:hypothetical protein